MSAPRAAFERRLERLRVQNLGQNLERFHQARAGAIEILIAIRQINLAAFDGAQLTPFRPTVKPIHLRASAVQIETAGHGDDDIRVRVD
jgi:hypothetical protein